MTGPRRPAAAADGLSLAFGLLTILPVRVARVDPPTARAAVLLAPLVGLVLAIAVGAVGAVAHRAGMPVLATTTAAVATAAVLTRGLHLDGLADTADGLGSGRPPLEALEVLRRSDIGPFGVVSLVLVLLLQVTTAAALVERGAGAAACLALVAGRLAVPLACRRGVPAARVDGLGALVADSVPIGAAGAVASGTLLGIGALAAAVGTAVPAVVVATAAGAAAAVLLTRHCVRRFGGVTGDVLGAAVETGATAYLGTLTVLL